MVGFYWKVASFVRNKCCWSLEVEERNILFMQDDLGITGCCFLLVVCSTNSHDQQSLFMHLL